MDILPEIFRVFYVTGALGTVGYLAFVTSRRLPRWLWTHRPRKVDEWLRAVLVAVLGVLVAMVVMSVTILGWPLVLSAALLQEKRNRARRRAIEVEEDEALLQEVRSLRRTLVRRGGDDADQVMGKRAAAFPEQVDRGVVSVEEEDE